MLRTPGSGQAVINATTKFLTANDLAGVQLDIEMLDKPLRPAYEGWVRSFGRALHAKGKELSITIQASEDDDVISALADAVDYVVPMAYDEHAMAKVPGPIASAAFVDSTVRRFAELVPASKLVVGIGAYGYDWSADGSEPQSVTNSEAIALAAGYRDQEKAQDVIDFDQDAIEPTFEYTDDNKVAHEVWYLDGVTVANAMKLTKLHGARGAAFWALGMEDTSTWNAFGRNAQASPDLHVLDQPLAPEFLGDGELLTVRRTPSPGARQYAVDANSGLITDENYLSYPTSWLVARQGDANKSIALTFDDGPDPTWTPAILDILKRHHLKATFFLIGENAVAHPDLVRRIFREGHEIGNHSFTHPNMAHVGPTRIKLELAACQRAIEAIIGRSTRLFRPPYNADADPASYGEIMPVWVANQAGYLTAGESIDPDDWQTRVATPNGDRKLTGADVTASVLKDLGKGHAILLHDGGGDRSATADAVERLIVTLQARGYHFVTMGELAGMPLAATMPAVAIGDERLVAVDDAFFSFQRAGSIVLFWGFSIAIALGLARIAFMLGLLSIRSRRPAKTNGPPPRIDVMIAAYNEEAVIAKTIASILASRDADLRVIVVDDGSTDGTLAAISHSYESDPRVLKLTKPNGGKASALNFALARVEAPIVVGVDADTQIDPGAIAALARRFEEADVAAVAGNVKVGNRRNFITRWQSIEYITSQNIDRRALSQVNAITVVPGAIGAWRTQALRDVGGYSPDTLAEDMDLTWRLRRANWRIVNEPRAIAYTEAPATISALMKQRFRWTFGTLQCLWKHRSALFHYGWFGGFALPSLWLFQILMQVLAPLVDLQLIVALGGRALNWIATLEHSDISPAADNTIWLILAIYLAFLVLELAAAWVAFSLDREDKRLLWLQPLQRVVYRQIMYIAVWRALSRAAIGASQAWGTLRRIGDVSASPIDEAHANAK
jgi:cellulose synthase/poly-beta-1,6-N-acetylglucosamine synthase-like glycosyltransferase/peptidoglycan/xylan/chitin deacetylase (PgdA/CDA1 family)